MPPKKSKPPEQLGLGESPERPPSPPKSRELSPARVEYNYGTAVWICKRFDALVAELPGLTLELLPRLQMALEIEDRQWLIARRLFGIMPQTPDSKYPIADMRIWSREDLAEALGILKLDQWQQEMQAILGIWKSIQPREEVVEPPVEKTSKGLFSGNDLVKKYNFERIQFHEQSESIWFESRLQEIEKLFSEKTTAFLARQLITTELQLNRIDEAISASGILGKDYRSNMDLKAKTLRDYDTVIKTIDKLAPWFGAIAGKYSFKGALSEVTAAIQAYQSDGNNALVDGIFTATEIQVELRRSVQAPEPRYRAGLVVYALEAKANLWNAKWKSEMPHSVLAKMDKAFREAIKAAGQETGEVLPDLEKTGPEGEYPPLLIAPPPVMENSTEI